MTIYIYIYRWENGTIPGRYVWRVWLEVMETGWVSWWYLPVTTGSKWSIESGSRLLIKYEHLYIYKTMSHRMKVVSLYTLKKNS